jgi:hypothetical protein
MTSLGMIAIERAVSAPQPIAEASAAESVALYEASTSEVSIPQTMEEIEREILAAGIAYESIRALVGGNLSSADIVTKYYYNAIPTSFLSTEKEGSASPSLSLSEIEDLPRAIRTLAIASIALAKFASELDLEERLTAWQWKWDSTLNETTSEAAKNGGGEKDNKAKDGRKDAADYLEAEMRRQKNGLAPFPVTSSSSEGDDEQSSSTSSPTHKTSKTTPSQIFNDSDIRIPEDHFLSNTSNRPYNLPSRLALISQAKSIAARRFSIGDYNGASMASRYGLWQLNMNNKNDAEWYASLGRKEQEFLNAETAEMHTTLGE